MNIQEYSIIFYSRRSDSFVFIILIRFLEGVLRPSFLVTLIPMRDMPQEIQPI